MSNLKINKKRAYYILVTLIVFISMVTSLYMENLMFAYQYITDLSFRLSFENEYDNVFDFFISTIVDAELGFDYSIVFGTFLYQFIIPFFGSISATYFSRKIKTIEKFAFVRERSFRKRLIHNTVKISIFISSAVFLGFILYFIFCIHFMGDNFNVEVSRPLFLDWFGKNFYQDKRYLYVLVEGMVRFFWIPFVYSIFGIGIVLLDKYNSFLSLAPLIYFYGLSILGSAFANQNQLISIHFTPNVIMALGDYYYVNTIIILLVNSIPLFLGLFSIWRNSKYVEI